MLVFGIDGRWMDTVERGGGQTYPAKRANNDEFSFLLRLGQDSGAKLRSVALA